MRRLINFLRTLAAAAHRRLLRLWTHPLVVAPGQGLVEYGLILVLIMVVCVGILTLTGSTISRVWYEKLIPAFPN